jgi:circadian clock protein KaiB
VRKTVARNARTSGANRKLVLRLYVAGAAPHSTRALENVRAICELHVGNKYELDVVDVLHEPLRALDDGILVTPTLVRLDPKPVKTLIGDLSEQTLVLTTLGLSARGAST